MRLLFKHGRGNRRYAVRFDDGTEKYVSPRIAMAIYGLMAFRRLSDETLVELLWPDPDGMPDSWLSALRNTQLRARLILARGGVAATGRWRRDGWRLGLPPSGEASLSRPRPRRAAKAMVRQAFQDAQCYRIGVLPRVQYKVLLAARAPLDAAVGCGGSAHRAWATAARYLRLGAP